MIVFNLHFPSIYLFFAMYNKMMDKKVGEMNPNEIKPKSHGDDIALTQIKWFICVKRKRTQHNKT